MRELTKSTLSAGLAMSLFGMQTMMNVFRRPRNDGPNPAQQSIDAVTQAMVDQTGNTLRETFQVGDKVQREIVDLTFRFLTFASMRPGGGMSTLGGMTQQATGWLSKAMGGMSGARGTGCGCPGPGPSRPSAWPPPPNPGAAPAPSSSQPETPANPAMGWGPMSNQP